MYPALLSAEPPQEFRRRRVLLPKMREKNQIASRLLSFCVVSASLFEAKAINALLKRLKGVPHLVDQLLVALRYRGQIPTSCVTFPRTRDGRIQIDDSKYHPTQLFVRMFRFPDLDRKQLQPNNFCRQGHEDSDMFCVNPYHYEKVSKPIVGKGMASSSFKEHRRTALPQEPRMVNPSPVDPSMIVGSYMFHSLYPSARNLPVPPFLDGINFEESF